MHTRLSDERSIGYVSFYRRTLYRGEVWETSLIRKARINLASSRVIGAGGVASFTVSAWMFFLLQTAVTSDTCTRRGSRSLRRYLTGGTDERRRLQRARIVARQAAFFGGQMALMADAFPSFPREPPPPYCQTNAVGPCTGTDRLPANTT